ncbi:DUF3467 domain-containing protein [Lacisediminimonas sp.]|uniref:DUF3467 domain-containing protein n=1 Tax=Lacisediminimonas sp. TaxID=3060582 RepID=UPI002723EFF7|nr:DUF3467 domain-containing protein [Lacisediminimonas sp.]MDO8299079.1 DUF3467 domain-containing protein [Lacisediminimonas sp.]MDO9216044.1 DUF3467 domain-containing protein [Lacisediminimonas sp.]
MSTKQNGAKAAGQEDVVDVNAAAQATQAMAAQRPDDERKVKVRFDDRNMASHYANVANVGMSKDEVTLLFGTNQTWGTVGDEIVIALSSRIIMTPSVAKNFAETLQRVLQEYETKVGKIV